MRLRICEQTNLTLPIDTATDTIGVLAIKGAGKTHTSMVLAEELANAGVPVVVFDVVGVCWGLRLAASGKGRGLPFVILGGAHGDCPLAPGAGKAIADLVVADRTCVVLDVSTFETKAEQSRFIRDFCARVYQTNREPLHIIMDEADDYLPQKPFRDELLTLRAVEVLVRRGRAKGIGVTLITQRSAAINKGVLTQVSTLIVGRTISPQDRDAVKRWVDAHGSKEQIAEFWDSIASLPTNEKWIWSPTRDVFARAKIRARETFDSSSTPKVGAKIELRELAPVDIEALRERIAKHVEEAKADDPKLLRARVKELEKIVDRLSHQKPETRTVHHEVKVPTIETCDLAELERIAKAIGLVVSEADAVTRRILDGVQKVVLARDISATIAAARNGGHVGPVVTMGLVTDEMRKNRTIPDATMTMPLRVRAPVEEPVRRDGVPITGPTLRILRVLAARYPNPTTQQQLGVIAGYPPKGSTIRSAIGALRTQGLATAGWPTTLTEKGRRAAGDVEPLPTGAQLVEYWAGELDVTKAKILRLIFEAHPRELTREEISHKTDYPANGSTIRSALGRLRTLELVEKKSLRLSDAIVEAL